MLVGKNTTSSKEYVTLAQGIQKYLLFNQATVGISVTGYAAIDEDNWVDVFDTVRKVRSPTKGKCY